MSGNVFQTLKEMLDDIRTFRSGTAVTNYLDFESICSQSFSCKYIIVECLLKSDGLFVFLG